MTTEAERINTSFEESGLQILVADVGLLQQLVDKSEDKAALQAILYNLDRGFNFKTQVP